METARQLGLPTPVLTPCLVACRYIQLPINVQMPEAWQQPWQLVPVPGESDEIVPLMEAAARQQVGVFGSGPLQEGSLLQASALLVSTSLFSLAISQVQVQCRRATRRKLPPVHTAGEYYSAVLLLCSSI